MTWLVALIVLLVGIVVDAVLHPMPRAETEAMQAWSDAKTRLLREGRPLTEALPEAERYLRVIYGADMGGQLPEEFVYHEKRRWVIEREVNYSEFEVEREAYREACARSGRSFHEW